MGCGERPSQNCIQAFYNLSQCWHGIHNDSGREVNQSRWLFPEGRVTAAFRIPIGGRREGRIPLADWVQVQTCKHPRVKKVTSPKPPREILCDSNTQIIMIFLECYDNRIWAKFVRLNNYTTLSFFLILFLFFEPLCLQELGTALGQTWHLFNCCLLLSMQAVFYCLDGTHRWNVHTATSLVDDLRHQTKRRFHQWPTKTRISSSLKHTWCPPRPSIVTFFKSVKAVVYTILEDLR